LLYIYNNFNKLTFWSHQNLSKFLLNYQLSNLNYGRSTDELQQVSTHVGMALYLLTML